LAEDEEVIQVVQGMMDAILVQVPQEALH
jgi:hypothetical protein